MSGKLNAAAAEGASTWETTCRVKKGESALSSGRDPRFAMSFPWSLAQDWQAEHCSRWFLVKPGGILAESELQLTRNLWKEQVFILVEVGAVRLQPFSQGIARAVQNDFQRNVVQVHDAGYLFDGEALGIA